MGSHRRQLLASRTRSNPTVQSLPKVGEDLTRWATSDVPRVPTGFSFFDRLTNGGIATGEIMIAIARTGVGKSWFGLNVLARNAGIPAVLFSIEMHARYSLKRLAGIYTDVPTAQIEKELVGSGRSEALSQTISAFPKLAIEDSSDCSIGSMHIAVEEYELLFDEKPKLVIVDYLELIRSFGTSQAESTEKAAWGVKQFARENDVAVVLLHQVSRSSGQRGKGEDKNNGHVPLSLADGKFGGEQSADYMMGMYKPGMDPTMPWDQQQAMETDFRLQFLKTRSDFGTHPMGKQHHFNPKSGRISELQTRY